MKNLIFKIAILAGTVAAFASCSDTWLMYDTSQKDKLYLSSTYKCNFLGADNKQ